MRPPSQTSRYPFALHPLILSLASLVLTLLILEVCTRWFFFSEIDVATLRHDLQARSIQPLVEPSADPALLFELKPNLRRRFKQRKVITGKGGYRIAGPGQDAPTASPLWAGLRIAVVGDSTAFGWGVAYRDTYPERYRLLMERLTAARIEVRNYSVPGYNAQQELRTFQTKIKPYRPDLIILHHDHNDAEPTSKLMGAAYMPAEYGDNPLRSALLKWSLRRLRRLWNERSLATQNQGHRQLGGYIVSGPLYDAHLQARRELVDEAKAMGIPVIVVIFNTFVSRDDHYEDSEAYTLLHRDLSARLSEMGYHVLDLYPLFQAVLRERGWPHLTTWWVTPNDGHPNAEGHEFIAEKLVDYTRQHPRLLAMFKPDNRRQ